MTSGPGSRGEGGTPSGSAASSGADGPEVGIRGPRSEEGRQSRSARGLSWVLVFESYLALSPELQKGAEAETNEEGAGGPPARALMQGFGSLMVAKL